MQKTLKILFVVNPIAGGRSKTDWETAIRESFRQSPHRIEFFIQTGKGDEGSIRYHLSVLQPDSVVAVGGDGTVKMVAELLQGTAVRMGIIPAGSANGLARELGIPLDLHGAIRVVLHGNCSKLDAIQINNKELCFHLSDVGMNALLVRYFEESKTRGMWGYGRSLFKMFWNKQRMQVSIKTDHEFVHCKAYMVVLANAEKYGTGAIINPNGNVADGKFEVVVVRKLNLIDIVKAVMARKTFQSQRIEVFRTKHVELQLRKKHPFQVDGEYLGKINFIQAHIVPGIVNVMLPAPLHKEELAQTQRPAGV